MISVSYLKSKLSLKETIEKINTSQASLIHVDLMDGLYVPHKNFTIAKVIDDLKDTTKLLDIHLMVKEPLQYLKDLVKLNVWTITFHLDSTDKVMDVINYIKDHSLKVGIALNPSDDVKIILPYIDKIDYCLIMSVIPGEGGQKFMKQVLNKVKYLEDKDILIGIDGGINADTIKYLKNYRIDNIVSGSYICMSDDYNKQINNLLKGD